MLTVNKIALNTPDSNVFSNIAISFLPSSITYLRGLNGSGKTSFLRILAGIQKPSSGEILYGKTQIPIENIPKPYCLYIGHNNAIKPEMSVVENILIWARLYDCTEAVDAAVHFFQLNPIAHKKCYELSAGNKQKVALSRLLACKSNIWLLDEADNNLDKENKELLDRLIISKADSGGIILLTTHDDQPRIKSASYMNMHDYE